MKLGMIGMGRMGGNMARRLMRGGHTCVVFDHSPQAIEPVASEGAEPAASIAELVAQLPAPRIVWLMVPAGAPTEETVQTVASHLERGDILVDGGNSYFKDDVRRARALQPNGIHYVDVGTSAGSGGSSAATA